MKNMFKVFSSAIFGLLARIGLDHMPMAAPANIGRVKRRKGFNVGTRERLGLQAGTPGNKLAVKAARGRLGKAVLR